jgi:hypothetical protein
MSNRAMEAGRKTDGGAGSTVARWLPERLETLEEFGTASLDLVAWELSLSESALVSAKDQAIAQGLIEVDGRETDTGAETYRLAGRRRSPT